MQEQAPQAEALHLPVEGRITVLAVARRRMAGPCRVHADLVCAACQQPDLEQGGETAEELHHAEIADS